MTRLLPVLLLLTGLGAPVRGQERALPSVPQSLSLSEAVALALRFNPALRQALNDRRAASWGVRNAYGEFLPSLTASGAVGYEGSGSQTFAAQQFTQQSSTVSSNYSLSLTWGLSGATLMQPGLRRAQLRAVDASVDGARLSVQALVTQQYLAVLQATARVGLAEAQLTRNDEFLRLAQARLEVGQGTLLDVRSAEVARGQAEVGLLQARNTVLVEKLRLFQQMGVPAPDDPRVVTLPDTFPVSPPGWTLPGLLAEADAANPALSALRAQEASARAGERAARSRWFPSLSVSAGWSGYTQQYTNAQFLVDAASRDAAANFQACTVQNQVNTAVGIPLLNCSLFQFTPAQEQAIRDGNRAFPFDFTRQPFSARLTVSLPIFDQFSRPYQVSDAAARTDDAREALRSRELQVRTEVTNGFYGLTLAFESVRIQESNRAAAGEQLRLATERYRVGSGTFFELLDAQLAAQRAESDHVTAIYDYHKAVAALENAVGRPLRQESR